MDQEINDRYTEHERNAKADEQLKLAIGDRVIAQKQIGTVDKIEVWTGANMYSVRFDKGGRWAYRGSELKRI
jgi:hypothetical protein